MRTLLLFAGGRATRLGGVSKGLLRVGTQSVVERILEALGPLVEEKILLVNDTSLSGFEDVRLVEDTQPHAGVLPALARGLGSAQGDLCLVVACDMPFASPSVFELLLTRAEQTDSDVAIPRWEGGLEPMHAVYRRAPVTRAIDAALARGDQRMISYFKDVQVYEAEEEELRSVDPSGLAFFNINTPDDLSRARLFAEGQKRS